MPSARSSMPAQCKCPWRAMSACKPVHDTSAACNGQSGLAHARIGGFADSRNDGLADAHVESRTDLAVSQIFSLADHGFVATGLALDFGCWQDRVALVPGGGWRSKQ